MSLLRQATRSTFKSLASRSFSVSVAARKDLVQELYLKELQAFKPTPQAKDAHKGQVKDFSAPSAPSAPSQFSSSELAKELEAYESASIADASAAPASSSEGSHEEHAGETADEFLESLRADVAQPTAHH